MWSSRFYKARYWNARYWSAANAGAAPAISSFFFFLWHDSRRGR